MARAVRRSSSRRVEAVGAVVDATRRLFHQLRAAASEVHGQGELTAARRGVLESLARDGPRTVPELARARPTTRQHIQVVVNALLADGLVERLDNPAHRRSKLVRVTAAGAATMAAMAAREAAIYAELAPGLSAAELGRAVRTLESLRRALAAQPWRRTGRAGTAGRQ